MWNKLILGFVFLFALYVSSSTPHAQTTVSNIIAQNITADGAIVELDIPMHLDGRVYVLIVWLRADGQQTYVQYIARGGKHIYEVRHHPLWQGPLRAVATNIDGINGTVRRATFLDEMKLFLTPERLTPATINMLSPKSLFLWSWNYVLLGILGIFALFFYLKWKQGVVLSLVFGFAIAWGVMDLRKMYDHWKIVQYMETEQITVPAALSELKTFLNQAAEKIGDKSWRTEGLNVLELHMAEYSLASYKYALRAPSKIPADYIITFNPNNRETVWQYGRYHLVRGKN